MADLNSKAQRDLIKLTRTEQLLVYIIVFTAGFVDVIGYLKWKTYVSLMSGNTTQMGIYLNKNSTTDVLILSATAIMAFVVGIFLGTILSLWKRNTTATLTFFIVAALYTAYTVINYYHPISPILSISFFGLGVGLLNTVVTAEGKMKLNSVFITGALVNMSIYLSTWMMSSDKDVKKTSRFQAFNFFLIWFGFLLGTYVGSLLITDLGNWILMIPVALVLLCAFIMHYFCKNLSIPVN